MSACLSGLRVIDLSRVIAAPWAAQMLADFGAEVIKVERPERGDDTRSWGPVYVARKDGQPSAESAYFVSANRGKQSITVDFTLAEGAELIKKLAAVSDILIENHKVGSLARYGLDYQSLAAINPRLIYCSLTGYGQTGPNASLPSYDLVIQGESGFMAATGHADHEPGGGPMRSAVPFADMLAGAFAVVGILAAIEHRRRTGSGQQIDVALLDSMIAAMPNVHVPWLLGGRVLPRTGNSNPNVYPNEPFPCADGSIVLAVANDTQFLDLCSALGAPDLAEDPRFANNNQRSCHRATLGPLLTERLRTGSVGHWVQRLRAAGVPCGALNPIDQIFGQEQVRARELAVPIEHPALVPMQLLANPLRFSAMGIAYGLPPPVLGEHTEHVLRETLGMDSPAIERLWRSGALGPPPG
jgi:crotonobetainyl-CoA:carnitine CoA-transferase CaiB-like acyl-CoA transferase